MGKRDRLHLWGDILPSDIFESAVEWVLESRNIAAHHFHCALFHREQLEDILSVFRDHSAFVIERNYKYGALCRSDAGLKPFLKMLFLGRAVDLAVELIMLIGRKKQVGHLVLEEKTLLHVGKIDVATGRDIFACLNQHYAVIPGGYHGTLTACQYVLEVLHQILEQDSVLPFLIAEYLLGRCPIFIEALVS